MNKIPKKIHYCWFGESKFNLTIRRCIASWNHNLPDYELCLWNEDTFDISSNKFVESAYKNKKYAFVSDYVRMLALHQEGGIYLDTDVEVFKSFNPLLTSDFFIGLENIGRFGTSTIGCRAKHWLPEKMLNLYDSLEFDASDLKKMVNVTMVSNLLLEAGFKPDNHIETISNQVKLPIGSFGSANKQLVKPETIYAEHLFDGSWNKGNKSKLSKSVKYITRGGLSIDINNLTKLTKYYFK
ncbi:glycosyltransferase family 32 protein [Endozoicomonas lisbonensis]|uniref:Glycosyl transferase n=1 Tax=Endozoicomonas lisbonensis TaxID=3120522 RepID=A0ABV2SII6_9GAMM